MEHNQKAINLIMALQLVEGSERILWQMAVKEDALEGPSNRQQHNASSYRPFKARQRRAENSETPISGMPMRISEGLLEQTRIVTGATEVMSGEVIGKGMSGAAIATLQAQAMKPLEEKQKAFWRAKQRQGIILAEFFKFYYESKPFSYEEKDADGQDKAIASVFDGREYVGSEIHVTVQAGAATAFSEGGDIAMLEALLAKDIISKTTFVEAYPDNALSNKQRIQDAFAREEEGQVAVGNKSKS